MTKLKTSQAMELEYGEFLTSLSFKVYRNDNMPLLKRIHGWSSRCTFADDKVQRRRGKKGPRRFSAILTNDDLDTEKTLQY